MPAKSTSSGRLSWWDSNEHVCRYGGTSAMLKTTLANCPSENLSPVSAHRTLSGTGYDLTTRKAFDFPRVNRRFHEKAPKRSTLGAWKRSWWDSNEHICRHSCTSAMLETTLANCPPREPVARFGPQCALWDGTRFDRSKTVRLSARNSPIPRKTPKRSTLGAWKRRGKRYRAVRIFGRDWPVGTNWHELACFGVGFVGDWPLWWRHKRLSGIVLRYDVSRQSDIVNIEDCPASCLTVGTLDTERVSHLRVSSATRETCWQITGRLTPWLLFGSLLAMPGRTSSAAHWSGRGWNAQYQTPGGMPATR
jgi:hypothetical protein